MLNIWENEQFFSPKTSQTIKIKMNMPNKGISNNQWCGFLLGGTAHNVIFEEQAELLCRYWKNEDELVDYLLIDYFFYIIFNEIKQANREWDEVTEYAGNVLKMQEKMAETTYEVSDFPIFSKLNWKSSVELSNDGKLTLYQKILLDSGFKSKHDFLFLRNWKYQVGSSQTGSGYTRRLDSYRPLYAGG